jgi:hypothetical protein
LVDAQAAGIGRIGDEAGEGNLAPFELFPQAGVGRHSGGAIVCCGWLAGEDEQGGEKQWEDKEKGK